MVGQWPAASHMMFAPAHPCASPLRGISPALWSARPPPRGGSLSPRAYWFGFATGFVAGHARNTGATGLTACKPAWPLAYFSGTTIILITIVLKSTWAYRVVSGGLKAGLVWRSFG